MPNFAQNSVVMSSMATKKYIWAYFRRKSMDLGPKKYTSRIEVPCPTPANKTYYIQIFRGKNIPNDISDQSFIYLCDVYDNNMF